MEALRNAVLFVIEQVTGEEVTSMYVGGERVIHHVPHGHNQGHLWRSVPLLIYIRISKHYVKSTTYL